MIRPSLHFLLAGTAALAAVANGAAAAGGAGAPASPAQAPTTRVAEQVRAGMAERDRQAARRARALQLREAAARAAQTRAGEAAPPPRASTAAREVGVEEPSGFDDLAKIYGAMKPAKAALVFEQLSMDVQVEVASRMRERSTGLLMANMTPGGAARLSMALARRRPR